MNKPDIESILLANWYLINCKKSNGIDCDSINIARQYLTTRINKALIDRKENRSIRASFLSYFR